MGDGGLGGWEEYIKGMVHKKILNFGSPEMSIKILLTKAFFFLKSAWRIDELMVSFYLTDYVNESIF